MEGFVSQPLKRRSEKSAEHASITHRRKSGPAQIAIYESLPTGGKDGKIRLQSIEIEEKTLVVKRGQDFPRFEGRYSMTNIESREGFYIGDISYVLGDDVYRSFVAKQKDYGPESYEASGKDFSFAAAPTAHGDGIYYDDDDLQYPVDSGYIGLVPLELVDKDDGLGAGTVVHSPGITTFECTNGTFTVCLPNGHVVHIVTGS